MYDFGFCAMDILSAVEEDSGTYELKATNRCGTATSSITISIKGRFNEALFYCKYINVLIYDLTCN